MELDNYFGFVYDTTENAVVAAINNNFLFVLDIRSFSRRKLWYFLNKRSSSMSDTYICIIEMWGWIKTDNLFCKLNSLVSALAVNYERFRD